MIRDEFAYGPEDDRVSVIAEAVPVLACPACGEIFYGPEAEQIHHRAICKALGFLKPEQIRELRDRFGMSQLEFARLTGIGVATQSRWEQGRLMQTRSMDSYLQILSAVPNAIRVLEQIRGHAASGRASIKPNNLDNESKSAAAARQKGFKLFSDAA